MRKHSCLIAVGATALIVGLAGPAHAENPVPIPPGVFVIDTADALTTQEEAEVNERIKELQTETGQSLFVVYVDTFTNPSDPQKWVGATAEKKGLGSTDSMLAIAVKDRKAQFESHSAGTIAEFSDPIFTKHIRPALADNDWAEAGVAAADGIETAAAGTYKVQPRAAVSINPMPLLIGLGALIGAGGLAFGGWLIVVNERARRRAKAEAEALRAKLVEMESQGAQGILRTEELLGGAEERLNFILLEHGEIVCAHARKKFIEAETAMDNAVKLQKSTQASNLSNSRLLELWTEIREYTNVSVRALEGLEATATEFVESIARAVRDAQGLHPTVRSEASAVEHLLQRTLQSGERDTASRRESLAMGKDASGQYELIIQGLHRVTELGNTPEGLTALHAVKARLETARTGFAEANSRYSRHQQIHNKLETLEKNIVDVSRQAARFAPYRRHAGVNETAQQCLAAAKEISARSMDADVAFKELTKATQPMMSAVQTAVTLEGELAASRRDLPQLLEKANHTATKAEQYIRSHSEARHRKSMVSNARGLVEAALAGAEGDDLRVSCRMAKEAHEMASRALTWAKGDVEDAERARRAASYSSSSSSSSSYSFSSSSSGFGSGGSGGSFGGFNSGGSGGNF